MGVSGSQPSLLGGQRELMELYERALPQVYGYLRPRCDSEAEAEDLTSEVFFAAIRHPPSELTVKWLMAVARHKLVDNWRRAERDSRLLTAVSAEGKEIQSDPWDDHLDATRAREVLRSLGGHHRAALSLRYVDGLAVSEVAAQLGRTVHATEALLVRARRAFRRAYGERDHDA